MYRRTSFKSSKHHVLYTNYRETWKYECRKLAKQIFLAIHLINAICSDHRLQGGMFGCTLLIYLFEHSKIFFFLPLPPPPTPTLERYSRYPYTVGGTRPGNDDVCKANKPSNTKSGRYAETFLVAFASSYFSLFRSSYFLSFFFFGWSSEPRICRTRYISNKIYEMAMVAKQNAFIDGSWRWYS